MDATKYIRNQGNGQLELKIHSDIGDAWFFGEVGLEDVTSQIESATPSEIMVSLNSGGGSVWEGLGMYGYLKGYNAKVTVRGLGIVGSIASIVMQAANKGKREIMEGGLFFMHDPVNALYGNASDMRKMADLLDKIAVGSLAAIYADNNSKGKTKEEMAALMEANEGQGTWLTAQEAMEYGLIDRVVKADKMQLKNIAAIAAKAGVPKEVINKLNHNTMSENNASWLDGLKNIFKQKQEFDDIQNQIIQPVREEYEAKLKTERETVTNLQTQLTDLQAKFDGLGDIQAKATKADEYAQELEALKAKIKESGAPGILPKPDDNLEGTEAKVDDFDQFLASQNPKFRNFLEDDKKRKKRQTNA